MVCPWTAHEHGREFLLSRRDVLFARSSNTKIAVATAVINQFPVLIETYRAENARMCPACNADGVYTFNYTENNLGGLTADTITPIFPGFRVKEASTAPSLYNYKVVFTVAGCPACTESAVVTAQPHATAPAGDIVSNAIR